MNFRWLGWLVFTYVLTTALAGAQTQAPTPRSSEIAAANSAVPSQPLLRTQVGVGLDLWKRFTPLQVGATSLANSRALEQGIVNGTLYLTLRQTLEMALANNLDIASAGYGPLLAEADYLRTLGGGAARGVGGATVSNSIFSGAIGSGVGSGGGGGGSGAGSVTGGGSGVHGGGGGYDPTLAVTWGDEHTRAPLNSLTLYGTAEELLNQSFGSISYGQNFTTGLGVSISESSGRTYQNTNELFFNPQVVSDISVGFTQQLLNGADRTANRAFIIIGQNERRIAADTFRQKVNDTVATAAEQYWSLAAAGQRLEFAQEAEANAQKTVDDTQTLVNQGKVPEANLLQARSQWGMSQQARMQAETEYAKQASKLKLYLAKQWNPAIINARVVARDTLPAMAAAAPPPVDQMIQRAVSASPALDGQRLNIEGDELAVRVRKNGLLPGLALFGSYTSSGVAGVEQECAVEALPCPTASILPPAISGLGTSLANVFSNQAPDYGFGVTLSVPVFNRQARADMASAQLQLDQDKVNLQNQTNQVAEQINEARIELEGQTRQFQAAREGVDLARQSMIDEQEKYQLGKSTMDTVLAAQTALNTAENQMVTVQLALTTAQVEMQRVSGTILDDYHILIAPAAPGGP